MTSKQQELKQVNFGDRSAASISGSPSHVLIKRPSRNQPSIKQLRILQFPSMARGFFTVPVFPTGRMIHSFPGTRPLSLEIVALVSPPSDQH